jgi:hypothetical protein
MPYIRSEFREMMKPHLHGLLPCIVSVGDLCYVIYYLMLCFAKRGGNFLSISGAISAAQCAILELYRREASPYEDLKIEENGDIEVP